MDLENVTNAATNMVTNAKNVATGALDNAKNLVANAVAMPVNTNPNAGNGLFDMAGKGAAFKDFMDSNSIVARIAFLLLVIFVFIVVLQISIRLMVYFFKTTNTPYLIYGQVDASTAIDFPQDTTLFNAHQIPVSVNQSSGIEFTWSIWIFISPAFRPIASQYYHVFSKGNMNFPIANKGLASPNNGPGLYLKSNDGDGTTQNNLVVFMDTISTPGITNDNNKAIITNIPSNKWINTIIRCQGSTIDVYINGSITNSLNLENTPKQNYGDVLVAQNGGFSGVISNLRYFNYALGINEIQNIINTGPSLINASNQSGSGMNSNYNRFFSINWYLHP